MLNRGFVAVFFCRGRESKHLMLTKRLNLRFYYIPLAHVGTPPETPVRLVAHINSFSSKKKKIHRCILFPSVPPSSGPQCIFSLLLPRTSGSVVRQQHQWSTDIDHYAVWNGNIVMLLFTKCRKFRKTTKNNNITDRWCSHVFTTIDMHSAPKQAWRRQKQKQNRSCVWSAVMHTLFWVNLV